MRKFLRGRLQGYGRAYRLNLKDTGWGMKLVVLVITGFSAVHWHLNILERN